MTEPGSIGLTRNRPVRTSNGLPDPHVDLAPLLDDLHASHRLVVLTGAGMGLASGIPTFRGTDPDAVWGADVMEMGTNGYFRRNPVGSWRWYRSRFSKLGGALPNAGHTALVALERWQIARGREFLLVTQNIDTLHGQAGSERVVEVHGRADRVRCSKRSCVNAAPSGSLAAADFDWPTFDANPSESSLPRCPTCGALVRAHVLWFDEYYTEHADYQFDRVIRAFRQTDLVVCIGTSFSVGVTAAALETRAQKWLIDPGDAAAPSGVHVLRAAQEEALPALAAALTG